MMWAPARSSARARQPCCGRVAAAGRVVVGEWQWRVRRSREVGRGGGEDVHRHRLDRGAQLGRWLVISRWPPNRRGHCRIGLGGGFRRRRCRG